MKKQCKKFKNERLKQKSKKKKEKEKIAAFAFDIDVFIIYNDAHVNVTYRDIIQVVDTIVSFHITPGKELFSSYFSSKFGQVKKVNEAKYQIVDMVDIQLKTNI